MTKALSLLTLCILITACSTTNVHIFGLPQNSKGLYQALNELGYKAIERDIGLIDAPHENTLVLTGKLSHKEQQLIELLARFQIEVEKIQHSKLDKHSYTPGNIGLYIAPRKTADAYTGLKLPKQIFKPTPELWQSYHSLDCPEKLQLNIKANNSWTINNLSKQQIAQGIWQQDKENFIQLYQRGMPEKRMAFNIRKVKNGGELKKIQLIPIDHHQFIWRCQYRKTF